ncbi:MAG: decarboxylating 6-phosphogluconate dehydrogenase [Acidimicrobiia bacterium]|nr:decarboxylating 6-phosphogluconate dehydrogenase [Acidimicrobiia bacterium]
MRLGMIGLGRMGGNMAERLRRNGHEVVGYDHDPKVSETKDLADLVGQLGDPGSRVAWVMVPAGDPTEQTIKDLASLMAKGDVIVDGGNSNFGDSVRRGEELAAQGIGFIDAGTSGGVWGLDNGYALMVGGTDESVAKVAPALETLAPPNGFAHVGKVGAGHYTKMVHNGIEYGMMQAYAEGFAILHTSDLGIDALKAVECWQEGSVVRSWLLDLLVRALQETPDFEGIRGVAADSGEGRWTVNEAVRLGVAAPVISAALFARFVSQDEDQLTMKVIAALRHQFGGHTFEKAP